MWIYYNQFGNLTTKIPHGEVIRQGATFNLYIAVDKEYFKEDIVNSTGRNFLSFTLQEIVNWINTKILATLKINGLSAIDVLRSEKKKFTKVKSSEMTFDFANNQEYIVFNYTGNHSLLTKPGNYEAVFQFKNKDTNETKPLGLIQFHCEKTYGATTPGEQITPDQYSYLLSTIGDKVSYADYDIHKVPEFEEYNEIAEYCINDKLHNKNSSYIYFGKRVVEEYNSDYLAIIHNEYSEDVNSYKCSIISSEGIFSYINETPISEVIESAVFIPKLSSTKMTFTGNPSEMFDVINKKYLEENYYNKSETDDAVVHNSGAETISGAKTFTSQISVSTNDTNKTNVSSSGVFISKSGSDASVNYGIDAITYRVDGITTLYRLQFPTEVGYLTTRSYVKNYVDSAIASIIDNAPETLNTFKEIAEYIESDKTGASQMTASINKNKQDIETNKNQINALEQTIGDINTLLDIINGEVI